MTNTASNTGSGDPTKEMDQGLHTASKVERYKSHQRFIETCLQRNMTPRGMKVGFATTALPTDEALLQDINKILRTTEIAIMRRCTRHYKGSIRQLQKELEHKKSKIRETVTPQQFLQYITELKRCEDKVQAECRKKKNSKLNNLALDKNKRAPSCGQNETKKKNRHFRRKSTTMPLEPSQVINLSSTQLNPEQIHLLSYGPKFCPTPGSYNEVQLLEDTLEGLRRVRLKEFWLDEEAPTSIPKRPKFYKKNYWEPPKGRNEALDAYCSTIIARVTSHVPQPPHNRNMSRKSREALSQLQQLVSRRTIRISPADKGGAVVIQDFAQYEQEAMRQLGNTSHYQALTEDPSKDIARRSNDLASELLHKDIIDKKCHDWVIVEEDKVRTAAFYTLPKVHKDRNSPPGRPIVSGVNGPTERLSKLADHWLKPVAQNLPSYLKDTTHLLQIIEEWNNSIAPLTEETLIVTIDVTALYPSIPQNEVTLSLKSMLKKQAPDSDVPPIPTLLKIVDHVLQNNVFAFGDKLYKQVQGTAMGTPMAPAIANLYMGWLEDQLLATSPWTIQQERWKRYIDDILLLWTLGEKELLQFLHWLNDQHQTIKFTWNYGRSNIPYLDVGVSIVDNRLVTDLHIKHTDANMVLPFHSSHPRHCLRSIPFGQSLRLRRICSTDELFQQRSEELKEKLMRRGYPKALLETAITKVAKIPRKDTLKYKEKNQKQERVPVVITHNPTHPPLGRWLKELMPTLHQNRRMQKAMPRPPMVGERNCHNLRRILMPTRPPKTPEQQEEPGCYKCSAKRCIVCQLHLQETSKFSSVRTGQSFTIRTRGTCKSTNLVYLIDCARCKDTQYVGETSQTLQRRFHAHRSNIGINPESSNQAARNTGVQIPRTTATNSRFNQDTLVARHFQGPGHTILDLRVTIIEIIRATDTTTRRARERFWRHKLKTNWPDGLNVFD